MRARHEFEHLRGALDRSFVSSLSHNASVESAGPDGRLARMIIPLETAPNDGRVGREGGEFPRVFIRSAYGEGFLRARKGREG